MKSQNGITLTSLAIYISLIFVILAMLATITANMQSGIKKIGKDGDEIAEINKFNIFFLQEIKKTGIEIIDEETNSNQVSFSTGKTFLFNSNKNCIQLKNKDNTTIDIAKNIRSCVFSNSTVSGKDIITVSIIPKNFNKTISIEFVLNPEEIEYEDEEKYVFNNIIQNTIQNALEL